MNRVRIRRYAIASFSTFIIAVIKDVLVSRFKLIPTRSHLNYTITYGVIIPVLTFGLIFSILVYYNNYKNKIATGKKIIDINFILATPTILCFLYGILMILFILFAV